jgi:hypoxanthine phosphoribosyltransferase
MLQTSMQNKIETLLSKEQIAKRISELAIQVRKDYLHEPITLLCVLKGSYIFCSDLMRGIADPVEVEFLKASSYGDATTSSGSVRLQDLFDAPLDGKNVLIVEDIVDTGHTIKALQEHLYKYCSPKSVKLCSLLSKPSRRECEVEIDYLGFEIEDKFVIGFGLDYAQRYRELPYIGVIVD